MEEATNKPSIIFKGILGQKAQITADTVKDAIINGKVNPVYAAVMLKKFSKIHEIIHKDTRAKGYIQDAIENSLEGNSKTLKAYGASITLASKGYWDYSTTEDPYLTALETIKSQVDDLVKLRKEELESQAKAWEKINNPLSVQEFGIRPFIVKWDRMPYLDFEEESGESSTNPPTKRSSEHLRFTL